MPSPSSTVPRRFGRPLRAISQTAGNESPASASPAQRGLKAAALPVFWGALSLCLGGCVLNVVGTPPRFREVAEAARPILELDPDAVWTERFNRLVELAPDSLVYLATHPTLSRSAAPDDLRVLVHVSLLRLLVRPEARPRVSATCLATTLDVLHLELKVQGDPLGTICWTRREPPTSWHELYPADLNQDLAGQIDAEQDRQALRAWWVRNRDRVRLVAAHAQLAPRADELWEVLGRRYADRWTYAASPRAIRCAAGLPEHPLLALETQDYNFVRAACIWLGATSRGAARERLVDLVGSPSPIVAHNAIFALRYCPDPRIREVLERYKQERPTRPPAAPNDPSPPEMVNSAGQRWENRVFRRPDEAARECGE